ncbi:MAG: helix-turn-helix domain-containing protein [Clostridia bacterium]|nr:helix-turn-helix domain-containing protein [Clostridia bacterium]
MRKETIYNESGKCEVILLYEFHQLTELDFHIKNIVIREEVWREETVYDYTTRGRVQNLIHITTGGTRYYRIGDETLRLQAGELIMIPDGTRYYTANDGPCSGIGICFDLCSAEQEIALRQDIYHCWTDRYGEYTALIREMTDSFSAIPHGYLHRKSRLWLLLDKMIADMENLSELGKMVEPALSHLKLHYRQNEPVSVYAAACRLSESHFRRKFQEYTGMTPLEYRDSLRFEEAKRLYAGGMSMTQIAERVGFCDASYLRRLYRNRTGDHFREYHPPEIT